MKNTRSRIIHPMIPEIKRQITYSQYNLDHYILKERWYYVDSIQRQVAALEERLKIYES
jgi:hypothetical protein